MFLYIAMPQRAGEREGGEREREGGEREGGGRERGRGEREGGGGGRERVTRELLMERVAYIFQHVSI